MMLQDIATEELIMKIIVFQMFSIKKLIIDQIAVYLMVSFETLKMIFDLIIYSQITQNQYICLLILIIFLKKILHLKIRN